jgi:hypothetical protein
VLSLWIKRQQKKLRMKTDKTSWAVRWKGHSVFCPGVEALSKRSRGQIMQPVVLSVLPGKGQERKEASFADLIFCSFHQGKEQSPPAAIEPGASIVREGPEEVTGTEMCYFATGLRISFALSKVAKALSSGNPCL